MSKQHLKQRTTDEPAGEQGFDRPTQPPKLRRLNADQFTTNENQTSESTILTRILLSINQQVKVFDQNISDLAAGPIDMLFGRSKRREIIHVSPDNHTDWSLITWSSSIPARSMACCSTDWQQCKA